MYCMKSRGRYTRIDTYTWIDLDRHVRRCTGQHLLLLFRDSDTDTDSEIELEGNDLIVGMSTDSGSDSDDDNN